MSLNQESQEQIIQEEENKNNLKKEVWVNSIKADGGAYKGCPKNDYCQHFVDTGERPQNFIRDYEEEKRFLDYPKLNELIKRKNEVLQKRATPPMWLKADLKNYDFSNMGKFDVILIDPPLEEYKKRAEGFGQDTREMTPWSFEELANIRIDLLAENCCFVFLWVGSSEGLDKGRLLLKKWNFRRCEDIVWIKTNKHNFKRKYDNDKDTLLQHTKEHCLVGIKGQVKRGVDGHFIHANIDTDVIVSEEPPLGLTEKPQELYRIIERFCLGRKRIELFGEDHNRRPGWLTIGKSLSSSNFDVEKYNSFFKGELCYPDVQGYEGGRYVGCTAEIENLRPRSPSRHPPHNKNNNNNQSNLPQQQQQQYSNQNFMNNFNLGFNFNQNFMPYGGNNILWNNSPDISRMNSNNNQSINYGSNSSYEYSNTPGIPIREFNLMNTPGINSSFVNTTGNTSLNEIENSSLNNQNNQNNHFNLTNQNS